MIATFRKDCGGNGRSPFFDAPDEVARLAVVRPFAGCLVVRFWVDFLVVAIRAQASSRGW
jgi:hypothetical protein